MGATAQLPPDHPMRLAWEAYKASDDFANTRRWAAIDDHMDGSLWAVFVIGWNARAAQLKERDARLASLTEVIDEAMRLLDTFANYVAWRVDDWPDDSQDKPSYLDKLRRYAALRARVNALRNGETP